MRHWKKPGFDLGAVWSTVRWWSIFFSCVRSVWVRLLRMSTWSGAKVTVPKAPFKPGCWRAAKIQARLGNGVSMGLPGCVRFPGTPNPEGSLDQQCGTPGVHTPIPEQTQTPGGGTRECLHWEGAPSQGFNALGWAWAIPVGAHASFPIQLSSCLKAFELSGKTFLF